MAAPKKIKLDFSIDGLDKSISSMKELEDATKKLKEEIELTDDADVFNKLSKQIAQATSKMKELELSMEGLDPEARASAFGAFAGGLTEATTGAVALTGALGITNESSMAMVETLASGMAVAQAFKGGIEGIIAVQKILKSSTIAQTVATNGGAVAMRILNVVMAANPIFLLITALAALVTAIALFAGGTNEAQEEAEELNATLEDQARAYDQMSAALDRANARKQNELDANKKLIESELSLLKSKKNLTDADKARIKELEAQSGAIDLSKIDSDINTASKKFGDLGGQIRTQFQEVNAIIEATDYEDGINDINYDQLSQKNQALRAELETILKGGFTEENVAEQIAKIEALSKKTSAFTTTLSQNSRKLGDAEKEIFDESISSSENLNKLLTDLVKNADDYKKSLTDKSVTKSLQENVKTAEEIAKENERAAKAADQAKEAARIQLELKKELLKIDQAIAVAKIDQSTLEGQEEAALLKRKQQLENDLAAVEGNSKRAKELRVKIEELAQLEMDQIRNDFNDKRVADEKATLERITKEREDAQDEWDQQEEDFYEEYRQATQDQFANERDEVKARYFELINLAEQYGLDVAALKRKEEQELTDIEEAAEEDRKAKLQEAIEKKLEMFKKVAQVAGDILNAGLGVAQALGDLAKAKSDAELITLREGLSAQGEELNAAYEDQKAALDEKFNAGLISQEAYNSSVKNLQGALNDNLKGLTEKQQKAELEAKKKAFESDKKMKIAQAIISGAQGAVSAFTGAMQLGPILGPVVGAVLAAAVVATTAIQVAAIKNTKFDSGASIPSAAGGGAGGAGGAGGGSAPTPPSLSLFGQAMGGSEGAGQQESGSRQQSVVRAVVVESDITNTQNRLATYQQRSEIG